MDKKQAFIAGVMRQCQRYSMDADDTNEISRLLLMPEKKAAPLVGLVKKAVEGLNPTSDQPAQNPEAQDAIEEAQMEAGRELAPEEIQMITQIATGGNPQMLQEYIKSNLMGDQNTPTAAGGDATATTGREKAETVATGEAGGEVDTDVADTLAKFEAGAEKPYATLADRDETDADALRKSFEEDAEKPYSTLEQRDSGEKTGPQDEKSGPPIDKSRLTSDDPEVERSGVLKEKAKMREAARVQAEQNVPKGLGWTPEQHQRSVERTQNTQARRRYLKDLQRGRKWYRQGDLRSQDVDLSKATDEDHLRELTAIKKELQRYEQEQSALGGDRAGSAVVGSGFDSRGSRASRGRGSRMVTPSRRESRGSRGGRWTSGGSGFGRQDPETQRRLGNRSYSESDPNRTFGQLEALAKRQGAGVSGADFDKLKEQSRDVTDLVDLDTQEMPDGTFTRGNAAAAAAAGQDAPESQRGMIAFGKKPGTAMSGVYGDSPIDPVNAEIEAYRQKVIASGRPLDMRDFKHIQSLRAARYNDAQKNRRPREPQPAGPPSAREQLSGASVPPPPPPAIEEPTVETPTLSAENTDELIDEAVPELVGGYEETGTIDPNAGMEIPTHSWEQSTNPAFSVRKPPTPNLHATPGPVTPTPVAGQPAGPTNTPNIAHTMDPRSQAALSGSGASAVAQSTGTEMGETSPSFGEGGALAGVDIDMPGPGLHPRQGTSDATVDLNNTQGFPNNTPATNPVNKGNIVNPTTGPSFSPSPLIGGTPKNSVPGSGKPKKEPQASLDYLVEKFIKRAVAGVTPNPLAGSSGSGNLFQSTLGGNNTPNRVHGVNQQVKGVPINRKMPGADSTAGVNTPQTAGVSTPQQNTQPQTSVAPPPAAATQPQPRPQPQPDPRASVQPPPMSYAPGSMNAALARSTPGPSAEEWAKWGPDSANAARPMPITNDVGVVVGYEPSAAGIRQNDPVRKHVEEQARLREQQRVADRQEIQAGRSTRNYEELGKEDPYFAAKAQKMQAMTGELDESGRAAYEAAGLEGDSARNSWLEGRQRAMETAKQTGVGSKLYGIPNSWNTEEEAANSAARDERIAARAEQPTPTPTGASVPPPPLQSEKDWMQENTPQAYRNMYEPEQVAAEEAAARAASEKKLREGRELSQFRVDQARQRGRDRDAARESRGALGFADDLRKGVSDSLSNFPEMLAILSDSNYGTDKANPYLQGISRLGGNAVRLATGGAELALDSPEIVSDIFGLGLSDTDEGRKGILDAGKKGLGKVDRLKGVSKKLVRPLDIAHKIYSSLEPNQGMRGYGGYAPATPPTTMPASIPPPPDRALAAQPLSTPGAGEG